MKLVWSGLPLANAETGLDLSLKPWLRRLPAALTDPRGELSLPAVGTLEVGPGSLEPREGEQERGMRVRKMRRRKRRRR